MHRARTTQLGAAAELRTFQIERVTQRPEQGHVTRDIHCAGLPVDLEADHHGEFLRGRARSYNLPRCGKTVQRIRALDVSSFLVVANRRGAPVPIEALAAGAHALEAGALSRARAWTFG